MKRRRLIAGNWKMNKTSVETVDFIRSLLKLCRGEDKVEILLLPPFTGLELAGKLLSGTEIALGAQNFYFEQAGAYTGEISARMLRDCGCTYVLVGHSERRTLFHEDDELINCKLRGALETELQPILCVGETLEEHRQGKVEERITAQLTADFDGVGAEDAGSTVIAYEPIWAIGTGETASPQDAQGTIHMIRRWLASAYGEAVAEQVRILYGGSVKPANIISLIAQPDIDGALVGGASLSPDSFTQVIDGSH